MNDIIQTLQELYEDSTPGEWQKGLTTHHTVSKRDDLAELYSVAVFTHASDAAFCDACHEYMPKILEALKQLAERNK